MATVADAAVAPPLQSVARHVRRGRNVCAALVLASAVLGAAGLFIGSHPVPVAVVIEALRAHDPADPAHAIVILLRVPRFVVGVVAGGALGAAGAVVQTMTRNPLAEPGLLGINAGASLAVATGLVFARAGSPAEMMALAMAGAAMAGALVLLVGGAFRSVADPVRLVLAGAAVSAVLAALTSALIINYPSEFAKFRHWDAGALAARPWPLVGLGSAAVALGLLVVLAAARSLDALALGADLGRALGASAGRAWVLGGLAVILLCGAATALAGPIGFLGLAATLGARRLVGGGLVSLLPVAALLAVVVLLSADLVGRVVIAPAEMQAGIVCALVGAPVFVLLARRSTAVVS